MLNFFLLMDLPTQVLIASPILLWMLAAPKFHGLVLLWGALVWGVLAVIMVRQYRRTIRAEKARELPQGDWRWPPDMSASRYAQQAKLYLHNFGWVALETVATDEASVTLAARKDRLQVVLRCLRDVTEPDEPDIKALAALKGEKGAGLCCLLLPARPAGALVREAAALGVQVMAMQDMAYMDDPDGPAAFARLRGR